MAVPNIVFGHSPDADDAFMFWGIASGKVPTLGFTVEHRMLDIQTLNLLASEGEIEVTAISAAHYPAIAHSYRIMSCGASIGRNYGPAVVSKKPGMSENELEGAVIGVPGRHTTSWMLYQLFAPPFASAKFLNFDDIENAVISGEVDFGILLHEGQILYEQRGFHLVMDLGARWFEVTQLPIPLGLDVVSRKLSEPLAQGATNALMQSIRTARSSEDEALDYALSYGRGISKEEARKFVRMYVNTDTEDMGEEGIAALNTLYKLAGEKGIISTPPVVDVIQARGTV